MSRPCPFVPAPPSWTREAITLVMLLTLSTKCTRVPVASTVNVAEPVADVLTAGTTSVPESSAVKVVATVERAVVDVAGKLVVVVAGALVAGGLVVVVAALAAQPERAREAARTSTRARNFFNATTSKTDAVPTCRPWPGRTRLRYFQVFTFSAEFSCLAVDGPSLPAGAIVAATVWPQPQPGWYDGPLPSRLVSRPGR